MRTVLVRFGGILFLVALAVWLYCLLDAITADRADVRVLPKGVWIAIVLFTFEVGSIAWLLWGRPREHGTSPRTGGRPRLGSTGRTAWPARPNGTPRTGAFGGAGAPGGTGTGSFRRSGPLAPDDDPEFLARLDRQAAQEHEKLLGRWEEDLRRREEELRQRSDDPDDPDSPRP